MTPVVRSEVDGGTATITLDSPANRNALSSRLLEQLSAALDAAVADDAVRSIVLTGAGTVFCAGADLVDPPGNTPGARFGFPTILQTIQTCPKPVIGKINGHVRAGGLGLVAACDLAIAPHDATFAFSEVRIGVIPAIIAVVCQPVMTPRSFARHVLTGAVFDAAAAAASGLVTEVVDHAELDAAVSALTSDFRLAAPDAIARAKSLIAELPLKPLDAQWEWTAAISAVQFQAADAVEGIAAFREKRPPRWAT
ncbi:MAG: Enoyl-CoA hydratase/isomerase [Ilumatobacteraceae bacterium]|jgi:methylglutaconyl-CoA hydratase|nr:Enoyl-CoA hydratase/isomerase [Ilumatobacteraceae bacterium]